MNYGPEQVDQWEPYQLYAVCRGFKAANTVRKPKPPSPEDLRRAIQATMH